MQSENKDLRSRVQPDSQAELLKARIEALSPKANLDGTGRALACAECGSPIAQSSQFCWMCGAPTRHAALQESGTQPNYPAQDATLDQTAAATGIAENPVEHAVPEQQSTQVSESSSPAAPTSNPAAAAGIDASDGQRFVPHEPPLFGSIYGRRDEESLDEEEAQKRFDYRLVALPLLLVVILFVGYRQRHNGVAVYAMLKQTLQQQMASLFPPDEPAPVSTTEIRVTANRTGHKGTTKTTAKGPGRGTEVVATKSRNAQQGAAPRTLRVRVDGQPGPEITPVVSPGTEPVASTSEARVDAGVGGTGLSEPGRSPMEVRVSPRESLSMLLKQVPPVYPEAARASGVQGAVVLKAVIQKDGNVGDLHLVSGDSRLVQAATDAVRQWVYRPYYRNGEPAEVVTLIVVEFSLASQQAAASGPGR